jgi:hypothetical protein
MKAQRGEKAVNKSKIDHGTMNLFKEGGTTMAIEKAKELRHAQTLRKIASEEAAEAAKMKCGGKVKKMAAGGAVRGTGAATKGKGFSGTY